MQKALLRTRYTDLLGTVMGAVVGTAIVAYGTVMVVVEILQSVIA